MLSQCVAFESDSWEAKKELIESSPEEENGWWGEEAKFILSLCVACESDSWKGITEALGGDLVPLAGRFKLDAFVNKLAIRTCPYAIGSKQ